MAQTAGQTVSLKGTVDEILFLNEANGYTVAELETDTALVTIVGEIGRLEPGEELELTGSYVNHPRFGQQFHAESCIRALPSSVLNIERYLAGGAIRGIGKALAKRIVAEFGELTLQVMENTPEKLARIKGISAQKCEEIAASAKEIFGLRSLLGKLGAYGVSASIAMQAYRRWGVSSWDIIQGNPYLLCGYGLELEFRRAELIARDMGISDSDPKRLKAGFCWILQNNANEGHTCLPLDQFKMAAMRVLELSEEEFAAGYRICLQDDTLIQYQKKDRPFVYLEEYYHAEDFIAARISAMLSFSPPEDFDCKRAIEKEEQETGMTYAELQKKAIACAFSRGIMVLTGGPGTGKTTTLNGVIDLCVKAGSTVLLAAPTGRAAKRMTELTGREAKTIHRLLGTEYDDTGRLVFQHHEKNPLKGDVLIVDEVSMVDVLLFESLLHAVRLSCRVILVGDEDQLPSVGAGNLLHTLVHSGCLPVVRLTEIFRQAQESCIIRSAHQIVNGELPDLQEKQSDFFFFDRRNAAQAAEFLMDLYSRRLPKAYGFIPKTDIQVISPTRKGLLGTISLNQMIQEAVNPPKYGKAILKNLLFSFREGDKVMQIQNQYEMEWVKNGERGAGVFNGDMGTVLYVDKASRMLQVDFDGRVVCYNADQLEQLELAYAVTVHKSQGSEFEAVILMLPEGSDRLSYRSLLYTAVTRAKKLLILIGSPKKVREMVQNHRRTLRYSCLLHMLRSTCRPIELVETAETGEDSEVPLIYGEAL
ncbi:MAG: ATP-dependent RecD-like DNA helicase [Oscillospiraceae bacterium]|nr:ATP-dependent RecD-like DNA helicase [Oscillospiraceae bacterium]